MKDIIIEDMLHNAILASIYAGKEILKVYRTDFLTELKKNETPITEADRIANKIIFDHLNKTNIPIISEEGKEWNYEERKNWEFFWLVDPLDGTKEFVNRNGEFTVNIALIKKDIPVLGVIYAPVLDLLFFAADKLGTFNLKSCLSTNLEQSLDALIKQCYRLPLITKHDNFVIIASRSHMNNETTDYIANLKKQYSKTEIISKGSSLKLCLIAEGIADIYPRMGPTMEWDIAAGHAIVKYAGGNIKISGKDEELKYNKPDLRNPFFVASR